MAGYNCRCRCHQERSAAQRDLDECFKELEACRRDLTEAKSSARQLQQDLAIRTGELAEETLPKDRAGS